MQQLLLTAAHVSPSAARLVWRALVVTEKSTLDFS